MRFVFDFRGLVKWTNNPFSFLLCLPVLEKKIFPLKLSWLDPKLRNERKEISCSGDQNKGMEICFLLNSRWVLWLKASKHFHERRTRLKTFNNGTRIKNVKRKTAADSSEIGKLTVAIVHQQQPFPNSYSKIINRKREKMFRFGSEVKNY